MPETNVELELDRSLAEGPEATLERNLIAEFLLNRGYQLHDLETLPEDVAKKLMKEASRFASLKLSEIESRNRFRKEIRAPGGQG